MYAPRAGFTQCLHALLLGGALILGGCAGFSASTTRSLQGVVQSANPGGGVVNAHQREDGSVMLIGRVQDKLAEQSVVRAAESYPGVTRVVNNLTRDR